MNQNNIELGDLIRRQLTRTFEIARVGKIDQGYDLIAKGSPNSPWIRHDGSSFNPIPGLECEVLSGPSLRSKKASEDWNWGTVLFYRITNMPAVQELEPEPYRPQEPRSTTTVQLELVEDREDFANVKWPNGKITSMSANIFRSLEWQLPDPILEIGGKAMWKLRSPTMIFEVRGMEDSRVWLKDSTGDYACAWVHDVTPIRVPSDD